jgi:DNA-binding transcriptional ArsR family regulator
MNEFHERDPEPPGLHRLLAHPTRVRIIVNAQEAVSAPDLAAMLGTKRPTLDYHIRILVEAGLLEIVRSERHRGALEHYYRVSRHNPLVLTVSVAADRCEWFLRALERLMQEAESGATEPGAAQPTAHFTMVTYLAGGSAERPDTGPAQS